MVPIFVAMLACIGVCAAAVPIVTYDTSYTDDAGATCAAYVVGSREVDVCTMDR